MQVVHPDTIKLDAEDHILMSEKHLKPELM